MSEAFDPRELPILAELEDEFARLVRAELHGTPALVAAPVARRAPERRAPARRERPALSAGRRILGRALAAGALIGAVGATALATKSVVRGDGDRGPVLLERAAGHTLTLRPYHGRTCLDVGYAGGVATACADAPGRGGVAPLSAVTPGGRVVAGLAGAGVARVVVHRGGRRAEAATRPVPGGGAARWFSVVLPALPREAARAATVAPRRADGAPAGRTVADCSLGTVASCRAAREHSEGRM